MQQECTPFDHVAAEAQMYRAGHADGRQAGSIDGHRLGFDQGYLAGHHDGLNSSAAYKTGEAHGFVTGYLERISDELARGEARK